MRKFKFRVWNVAAEKFVTRYSGKFGWPDFSEIKLSLDGELFVESGGSKETLCSSDFIIQQFTGLQDLDGKDIYEGDVLEIYINYSNSKESRYGLVHYHYHQYLIGVYDLAYSKDRMINNNYCSILDAGPVAGNIFENRDLLLR